VEEVAGLRILAAWEGSEEAADLAVEADSAEAEEALVAEDRQAAGDILELVIYALMFYDSFS
jgi:hypothetical protein